MSNVDVSAQNCLAGHDSVVSPSAGITGFLISSIMHYFYNETFISIKKKRKESLAKETTQMHKPKIFIVMLALGSEYTRMSYDAWPLPSGLRSCPGNKG